MLTTYPCVAQRPLDRRGPPHFALAPYGASPYHAPLVGERVAAGVIQRESRLKDQVPLYPALDAELCRRYGWDEKNGPTEDQAQDVWRECAEDPNFYIFGGFVRTIDTHDKKNRVKPFARYPFLEKILDYIQEGSKEERDEADVVAFPKSRQQGLTWLAAAYCSWEAKFHPHGLIMLQSKKADDAWKLVYKQDWLQGRIGFIERCLPKFLWSKGLVGTQGVLTYPNGSQIWGIPEGPHHFRGYTANLVVCDEACFHDRFKESYTAALTMAHKIILISTAEYGTYFGTLVEQDVQEEAA